MKKINFNDSFIGFKPMEDIFLDTGIVLALLNEYDAWHGTVKKLFESYIFTQDNAVSLFIHSGIINEITFLADRPITQYMNKNDQIFSQQEIEDAINNTIQGISQLIENDIIIPLDSSKNSILKQIKYCKYFGSMDALVVSILEDYGISF